MTRLLARILILAAIVGAVVITQNVIFNRREAMLRQIPKGATEARVIELLGQPARKGVDNEAWYYEPTFFGNLLRLRTDDMMVLFESGKVDQAFMTPE